MKKQTFITFLILSLSIFILSSCEKTDDTEITIISNSNSEVLLRDNIPSNFFGLNGANVIKYVDYTNSGLRTVLEKLKPKVLRVPGGTVANYWDWHTGWFQIAATTPNKYASLTPKNNSLTALKNLITGLDIEIIWVLNIMHSTLQDQIDMLKAARDLGFSIKYIELGNEFYSDGDEDQLGNNYITRFPTVANYVSECQTWIAGLKAQFPNVEISIVGSDVRAANSDDRTKQWNSGLSGILQSTGVGVTMHNYKGSTVSSSTSVADFFNDTNLAKIINAPKTAVSNYFNNEFVKFPASTKVWVTEYNLFQKPTPIPGSWTHAMYVATQSLELMSRSQVRFLIAHTLVAGAAFGSAFDTTNPYAPSEFLVSVPNANPVNQFQLSSIGEFFRLFSYAIEGAKSMTKLALNDSTGRFFGYSFIGGPKKRFIICNFNSTSTTYSFTGSKYEQISGKPDTRPSTTESLTIKTGVPSGKINLPAYSITVLE